MPWHRRYRPRDEKRPPLRRTLSDCRFALSWLWRISPGFVITKLIAMINSHVTLILENTFLGEIIKFRISFPVYVVAFVMLAVIYMIFSFLLNWRYYNEDISKIVAEI